METFRNSTSTYVIALATLCVIDSYFGAVLPNCGKSYLDRKFQYSITFAIDYHLLMCSRKRRLMIKDNVAGANWIGTSSHRRTL